MLKTTLGAFTIAAVVSGALALAAEPVAVGRCEPNPGRVLGRGKNRCETRCPNECYRVVCDPMAGSCPLRCEPISGCVPAR